MTSPPPDARDGKRAADHDVDHDVVLVLGGGNALGAFAAGVYEALDAHGITPRWIIGVSIGAINGALIAGSAPDQRIETLRAFWRPEPSDAEERRSGWLPQAFEDARRTAAVSWTLLAGRAGMFGPPLTGLLPSTGTTPSIFDTAPLPATLDAMIDFDRLNDGPIRFTATAVDLATGADVVFDSRERRIDATHIRASAALPVTFPPVEIDGRWLVDGSLSANLPLDPLFMPPPARPILCLAVDLLPLEQALPRSIGEAASRMQDLVFAAQSRRSLAHWQSACDARDDLRISLVRIAYAAQAEEVAGKAMDFSGETIRRRWASGTAAANRIIARIAAGALPIGTPGLHIVADDPGD